jgi:hypothetical protein
VFDLTVGILGSHGEKYKDGCLWDVAPYILTDVSDMVATSIISS